MSIFCTPIVGRFTALVEEEEGEEVEEDGKDGKKEEREEEGSAYAAHFW